MTTLLLVVGTRPEAIKLAPVAAALRARADVAVVTTGQHPQVAEQALNDLGVAVDLQLAAPPAERSLAELAAWMLPRLDEALLSIRPDWVVVQGDTTSALAGALAGHYRQIRVAHVEAGLRTGNLAQPFPEEANRKMIAAVATLHFAGTQGARLELRRENVPDAQIAVVGNTVIDAVAMGLARANTRMSAAFDLPVGKLVIVTSHRRENQGEVLTEICAAVRTLAAKYPDHAWLFPLHPNPQSQQIIRTALEKVDNVQLTNSLPYVDMLAALSRASLVLTDSGGLQEEVTAFGCPVVVLRTTTERPEGVAAGFATLAGRTEARIVESASAWLDAPERRAALSSLPNPYGDGHAAERIAARLLADGGA